jgi:hypothetical protein
MCYPNKKQDDSNLVREFLRGRVTGELGGRHIGVEGNRSSVPFGVEMEWGFGVGRHVNRCV